MRQDTNPYHVDVNCSGRSTPPKEIPTTKASRVFWFFAFYIPLLFVPTVELFQLEYSLGRVPCWDAYIGIFTPDYFILSFIVIVIHVLSSLLISSFIVGQLNRRQLRVWRKKNNSSE